MREDAKKLILASIDQAKRFGIDTERLGRSFVGDILDGQQQAIGASGPDNRPRVEDENSPALLGSERSTSRSSIDSAPAHAASSARRRLGSAQTAGPLSHRNWPSNCGDDIAPQRIERFVRQADAAVGIQHASGSRTVCTMASA